MVERAIENLRADLGKAHDRIDSLEKWRNWVLGIVAGIGMVLGAFAKNVGEILKHM